MVVDRGAGQFTVSDETLVLSRALIPDFRPPAASQVYMPFHMAGKHHNAWHPRRQLKKEQ